MSAKLTVGERKRIKERLYALGWVESESKHHPWVCRECRQPLPFVDCQACGRCEHCGSHECPGGSERPGSLVMRLREGAHG